MKAYKLLAILFIGLLFNCASTNAVLSDFDETINFDNYNTFVLCIDDLFVENTKHPNYDNNKVRELIGNAIETQMIKKGHKTNVLNPQLQAGFKLIVEQNEAPFKNCKINEDYGYWKECTIDTIVYTDETLVVYVSDFSKNQIIWQASIPCNLNRSKNELKSYVEELVYALFNEYPKVI